MRIDCGTDIGIVRKNNQDSCDCGLFPDGTAWGIVCDGMGGANGGNVASSMAVAEIKTHILENYIPENSDEVCKDLLLKAVAKANQAVFLRAGEDESLQGMGTTAVVLLARQETLFVAHVGDSRGYLISGDRIEQVTKDHSYVQNLVDLGLISQDEAKEHPKRNVITRALGVHETVDCDCRILAFKKGDTVLACSDGLSGYAQPPLLLEYSKQYSDKLLIQNLIAYATEAGGSDNITVIALHHA